MVFFEEPGYYADDDQHSSLLVGHPDPGSKILSMNHLLGINGVWIGFAIGPIAGFLLAYGYFRTGKWKNKLSSILL